MNVVLELRQRASLTQALLAGLAGISHASISAYENGHTSPTLEMVERLAEAVNLEVEVTVRERPPGEGTHLVTSLAPAHVGDSEGTRSPALSRLASLPMP